MGVPESQNWFRVKTSVRAMPMPGRSPSEQPCKVFDLNGLNGWDAGTVPEWPLPSCVVHYRTVSGPTLPLDSANGTPNRQVIVPERLAGVSATVPKRISRSKHVKVTENPVVHRTSFDVDRLGDFCQRFLDLLSSRPIHPGLRLSTNFLI